MALEDRGKEAAERKRQARLEGMLEQNAEPIESAIYEGVFNEGNAYGTRYECRIDPETVVAGEFITPAAPTEGTRVAVYLSAPGRFLFDCR